jgi:hypothetical protein
VLFFDDDLENSQTRFGRKRAERCWWRHPTRCCDTVPAVTEAAAVVHLAALRKQIAGVTLRPMSSTQAEASFEGFLLCWAETGDNSSNRDNSAKCITHEVMLACGHGR